MSLTSSIESFIMYRTVFTALVWPMRCIRLSACSSAIGFHCGSNMNARVATVKSKLISKSQRSLSKLNATWRAYPKPATDKVASSTLRLGFVRKSCNDLLLWLFVSLPSRLVYPRPTASSAGGMRSRVDFQNEKTTLQGSVD